MIYLDNAATTLKKPRAVIDAVEKWISFYSANPGRGGHKAALRASDKIYECRETIARLFNIDVVENVIFTLNTTMALNIAIGGIVTPQSHVVISGMEHNSVYRPIVNSGCEFTVAKADPTGFVSAKSVEEALRPDTSLIVINHASNVVGTINPIGEIGRIAKEKNIPLLVDAAQSAGVIDIDVKRDNISLLAFAGHKALYGPSGTGGLYVSPDIELKPIIFGGTGSMSESAFQPDFLPDRLESGTLNVVGIAGLLEGVKFVLANSTYEIEKYEQELTNRLIAKLGSMKHVTLFGGAKRVGVVGFEIDKMDSVAVCNMLDASGVAARGGLHCAPLAHQSLGTQGGLSRISVSCFNTRQEIDKACDAIYRIVKHLDA